jgi:hypothetical protein
MGVIGLCFPKIASGLGSRREAESSHDWGRSRFWSLGHGRRQLLWFEVTRYPTAEWLARQITEAFPWASAPAYLVRDNDRAYGPVFRSRVRATRPTDLAGIAMAKRRMWSV